MELSGSAASTRTFDYKLDEIICRHVIEHEPDVMALVTELYRIAKRGARITIVTPHYTKPHYTNPDWATDATHRNHFNSYSFNCFIEDRQLFPLDTEVRLSSRSAPTLSR